jgi:hypothetical protein
VLGNNFGKIVLPVGTPWLPVICTSGDVPSDNPNSSRAAPSSSSGEPSDFDLLGGSVVGRLTGGSLSTRTAKLKGPTVSWSSLLISVLSMICRPFTKVPFVL